MVSSHAPLSWNDPLQNRKQLGFGVNIDEKLKIIYHGYFDLEYIESVNGPIMLLNNLINPARPLDIITELSDDGWTKGSDDDGFVFFMTVRFVKAE